MKWYVLSLTALLFFSPGCGSRTREEALQKKEITLNQKEQELLLKEKTLQLKEEELQQKEKTKIDSSLKTDTTNIYNAALIGRWSVKMTCTEASCSGSAVGDTKSEQWDISYQGKTIIAKAMTGDKLIRIYTGNNIGNSIELKEDNQNTPSTTATTMLVRLQMINEKNVEGQREIVREDDCRIVYALQLKKQD
ncbi:MAG: hypothetical protein ABIU77_02045 [Ferruginibacter sp.]